MVLGLHGVHPELRVGMERVRRVLVWFDIFHRRFVILYERSIFRWKKSDEINFGMGLIHGHADLPDVSLAQDIWENNRMLVDDAVFICAPFHQSIRNLVEVKFLDVVGESARAVLNRPAAI